MKKKILHLLSGILLVFPFSCTYIFFQPQKELIRNPFLEKFSYEDVYFKTPAGPTLHGWLLKPKGKSIGTILFLHGNAENISTHVNSVLWLVLEGFTVFAFDYRGYGNSEGKPTIEGVHLDAEAALEKAIDISNNKRIIVLGQSLGGAIAVYTVANSPFKDNVKALIIDSAFSSYRKIAREKIASFFITWPLQYPLSFLFKDSYSPIRWIKRVSPVPIVIICGDRDIIVPVHHGSTLYEEALQPKDFWTAQGKGHIQAFGDEEIRKQLLKYLEKILTLE